MRSYPVELACNYAMWADISGREDEADGYWTKRLLRVENLEEKIEFCKKWYDKRLTLLEMEELITEFNKIEFDGEVITILNDD